VPRSIDLEHQSQLGAVEVYNKAGDDMLAAEFQVEHAAIPEHLPHFSFRDGQLSPQFPGAPELGL